MRLLLPLLLFLGTGIPATAQTPPPTYTLLTAFTCDASYTRPLYTFYEFTCRGPIFTNTDTKATVQLFWFSALGFYLIQNPGNTLINGPRKSNVVANQAPTKSTPGTFQVQFQIQTPDGLFHYGIWSGNWTVETSPRTGAQFPHILAGSIIQLDQSTVAILN